MKIFWKCVAILIVTFGLSGCGGKSSEPPVQTTSTNGSAIKGPFVKGSQVVAYKLNEDGTRSITQKTTTTTDNLGTYSFDNLEWSGATEIVITGQYFNERTNTLAPSDSLSAIINISQGATVKANINLFTHLAAMQIKTLMSNNKSVSTAISEATQTVINNFALPSDTNLTDLDPTKGSGPNAKANAELLRVSAALAGESSLIDALASAIADGNITNDSNGSTTFANVAQKVNDINLSKVSNNLEQNLSITDAPDANDTNQTASYATNTHAPKLDLNSTIYIDENSIDIIEIGASDDDGDTLTYSIVGGEDSAKFTIDASTGALSFKTAPDFETPTDSGSNNSYMLQVQVSDGTLIDSKMITVYVTNIVETKPSITPFSKTVAENTTINSTIGTIAIDKGDGTISKVILSGENNDTFSISNAGVITLSKQLDYEKVQSYNLTATATNEAGTSDSIDVNITVTNVAETKPTVENFSTTISEGTPIGTSIGKLSFDAGDSAITSIILSGDGNQSFAISNDGNITVKSTLDYETKSNYSLNATLSNEAGSSIANIDINITNIVETKPTLTPISINIDENITINSTIGTLVIDKGDGNISEVTLNGANSDTFSINNEGVITVVKALDYETVSSYNLTATAINEAGASDSVDVNITVNNINEAPVANDGNYTTSQDTNLTIDLKPLVSDVDSDNLSLKSFTDPSNGTVTHTAEAGVVIYTPNSGFSGNDSFTVTVTDDGNLTATATIYITVTSNGIAVDPYIVGAKFWADVNQDNIQDSNEISTPSDINGTFKFDIYVPDGTSVVMISQGIHNGKIFDGNISSDFNASKNGIISPITSIAKNGFSDSEIRDLFILNGFDNNLTTDELYLDPFDTSLLPLDGNMSNKSDSEINKFRRVLLANLIINNTLTMNNGYDMNKSAIQSTFFTDPDGSNGPALSPIQMMIDAGKMLDINTLKNGNARATARIFVTIFEYIRDQIKASFGNFTAMVGAFETAKGDAFTIMGALNQAYQSAYQAGIIDPKFGWVQNLPMLFVQPDDLGATDINITYTDTGNNVDITFMASGHNYYEGSTSLGQWQITDDGKVQANSKEFEFLGDKIKIYEGSAVTTYNITQVTY